MHVEPLTEQAFSGFGRILAERFPGADRASGFSSPKSDFWRASTFDPGADGQTEMLWVAYRNDSLLVTSLEVHWLTEQAIVPLLGDGLIHVVASSLNAKPPLPDRRTIRAFHVAAGQGICMNPGCWHVSFSLGGQVQCLMLTRTSTTRELAGHLTDGGPARETSIATIEPLQIRPPA